LGQWQGLENALRSSLKKKQATTHVHAVLETTDKPLGKDRAIFSGSLE
jgi:hypothetical protein